MSRVEVSRISTRRAVERCEQLSSLGTPPPWRHPRKLQQWLKRYRAIMALDISELAEMLRGAYPVSDITKRVEMSTAWASFIAKPKDPQ